MLIRPIAYGDVVAASLLLQGGSLSPDLEHEHEVDRYWAAVDETRARLGEVLVAEHDGEVVGVWPEGDPYARIDVTKAGLEPSLLAESADLYERAHHP